MDKIKAAWAQLVSAHGWIVGKIDDYPGWTLWLWIASLIAVTVAMWG